MSRFDHCILSDKTLFADCALLQIFNEVNLIYDPRSTSTLAAEMLLIWKTIDSAIFHHFFLSECETKTGSTVDYLDDFKMLYWMIDSVIFETLYKLDLILLNKHYLMSTFDTSPSINEKRERTKNKKTTKTWQQKKDKKWFQAQERKVYNGIFLETKIRMNGTLSAIDTRIYQQKRHKKEMFIFTFRWYK